MNIPAKIKKQLIKLQNDEITGYKIYLKLSRSIKNESNSKILKKISNDEFKHAKFWETFTQKKSKPNYWEIFKFFWISKILGLTFGIKLMEKGEADVQVKYNEIKKYIPEAQKIIDDENNHEHELIELIDEERLKYIGSIVLGLNDALVELTGALAGLTFALQNTRLIALAGLITGIAASFSMAASEYLSNKSDGKTITASLKSSIYTGAAYIVTVILLILPYLLVNNYFICLGMTLFAAVLIIFLFNYYISVAKDYSFKKRFLEMSGISIGVALLSFGIGFLIRKFFGIDV